MTTRRPLLSAMSVLTSLVLVSLAITGCSAITGRTGQGSSYSSPQKLLGAAPPATGGSADQVTAPSGESAPRGQAPTGGSQAKNPVRMVIRTKTMTLEVKDAKKSAKAVEALAKRFGGYLTNVSISSQDGGGPVVMPEGGQPYSGGATGGNKAGPFTATVTAKVPAGKFESFIAEARKLGDVEAENENQEDVTQQHADLSARLKNLRSEESRLRQFFAAAKNVREMLEVERELSRVRGEIESLTAQLDYLNSNVALATLTVTMHEPPRLISPGSSQGWGVGAALSQAIRNFVDVVNFLIMLTGGLLPFIIILLVFVLIVRWLVRRGRNGAAAAGAHAKKGPQDAPDDKD